MWRWICLPFQSTWDLSSLAMALLVYLRFISLTFPLITFHPSFISETKMYMEIYMANQSVIILTLHFFQIVWNQVVRLISWRHKRTFKGKHKQNWRQYWILPNKELRSNEPHVDLSWNKEQVRKWINRVRIREILVMFK